MVNIAGLNRAWILLLACVICLANGGWAYAQDSGSIRGIITDREFDSPLGAAEVRIVQTGVSVMSTEQGNYVFSAVPAGSYTMIFSKVGYQRQVREVVLGSGQVLDINVFMSGDFTDMEEFVVQDLPLPTGSESDLLELRLQSPALLDAVGSELISRAGASDAAGALNLVAGATVQDGKYATVRGLPDRYVSTLLNGIRLPTADENKRAVQLDLFPSSVIESLQVTKSFMPYQQGDASGGSVDIILKSIPTENFFSFKAEYKYNSQVGNRNDFLTYDGGGINFFGNGSRPGAVPIEVPPGEPAPPAVEYDFDGVPVGTSTGQIQPQYKWSVDFGGRHEFDNGLTVGGFATFFYDRDAAYFDNGINDSYWIDAPGGPLTPEISGFDGASAGIGNDFNTSLYDITEGVQSLLWGSLLTGGLEYEGHKITGSFMYTQDTTDTATLAEDTRGKVWFVETFYPFIPGVSRNAPPYDPNTPWNYFQPDIQPGNSPDNQFAAPYLRTQTLNNAQRSMMVSNLSGNHEFDLEGLFEIDDVFTLTGLELDWGASYSKATLSEDKTQFASKWAPGYVDVIPIFGIEIIQPSAYYPFKPDANFTIGNLQYIYKDIDETSAQQTGNVKLSFEQWTEDEGYLQFGIFNDRVKRDYDQETYANFNDNAGWGSSTYPYIPPNGSAHPGPWWDDYWSDVFPEQGHPITDGGEQNPDIDYKGAQNIRAYYMMLDLPLFSGMNLVGGARYETTELSIINFPEEGAKWFPPADPNPGGDPIFPGQPTRLNPGDADVDYNENRILPALALNYSPVDELTLRAAYSQTVARQTFKELSPILQQEFLGGPIFVGNPNLVMADLTNYDLRADWTPFVDSLVSLSWFYKSVENPIEYVQRGTPSFSYTTVENYPTGNLNGIEFALRQNLGSIYEPLRPITLGGNYTYIDSQVSVSDLDVQAFDVGGFDPVTSRRMTGAPEYLYNLYLTLDFEDTGTEFGLFYTAQGDTLVSGAGMSSENNFIPSVFSSPVGTLNLTFSQKFLDYFQFFFKVKNLTNPEIQTVYRTPDGAEALHTSYTDGIDFSIGLRARIEF